MTVHTCSPNSWTVEMGELPQVPDKSSLQSEFQLSHIYKGRLYLNTNKIKDYNDHHTILIMPLYGGMQSTSQLYLKLSH